MAHSKVPKVNQVKPRIDDNLSLEESLSVINAMKKDTSKEIVKLGRTRRRKIRGTKDLMKMKIQRFMLQIHALNGSLKKKKWCCSLLKKKSVMLQIHVLNG